MNRDNFIIICRHSERIDCTKERDNQRTKRGDPELTNNGINLSKNLGKKILSEFKPYIEQNKIKLYVSPFTRTLETAITLRNEMQNNLDKTNQQLFIVKNLGEWNLYNYNLYPNILFYNKNESSKNTELYNDLILKKLNEGNINYEIDMIEDNEIKFPETKEEADDRYITTLKKILEEIKNQ